ncbi:MAG: SDR family oxidoreductase [Acidobacteriota bacterium]
MSTSAQASAKDRPLVLLTGATGYVGGRLLRSLCAAGHRVRCLARRPEFLASRVEPGVEVVQGDVLDRTSLESALEGVDVAYYLVHSMGQDQDFERLDRQAARTFGAVAKQQGVRRLIYLGGLGSGDEALSPHLRSRHEVGDILRQSGVQTIELRASVVLGSGSLSFEMLRALVERLPVMVTPRWVKMLAQPIAITDLLSYLTAALDLPAEGHRTFEIGGADQVSYGDMMREYARLRGLRRLMIPVPVLTPRLSSLWLGLVTPLYARVGRKLIESICHPTIVRDPAAHEAFSIRPRSCRQALAEALRNEDEELAVTRWSDALSAAGPTPGWGGDRVGSRLVDSRCIDVAAPPEAAFRPIRRIGGTTGWYYANWLWRLRGVLDLFFGGVGIRRSRPDPENLQVGDALDWWRVEELQPNQCLRLIAEMKVPGRAWLEFKVHPSDSGSTIRQTAIFDSSGLLGLLYWYAIYPLHALVFRGMLRGIAQRAEA